MSVKSVVAFFTNILKVIMIERYIRVADVKRSQHNLMMNYITKPLVTLLTISAVNVNTLVNISLSTSLPPLAFIKGFSPLFNVKHHLKRNRHTQSGCVYRGVTTAFM